MNFEQHKQLLKQIPSTLVWMSLGGVLTLTIGQYQGSIEARFGEGYFKVVGEPLCEVSNK